jgi:hypothetical protein
MKEDVTRGHLIARGDVPFYKMPELSLRKNEASQLARAGIRTEETI